MNPVESRLPDGHQWLRVADPVWENPLDPSFAERTGGRWNPPNSYPTLYLNEDLDTARAQVVALFAGSPVAPEDLDEGFDLVVAGLPRDQIAADCVSDQGLEAVGLPVTYPRYGNGRPVGHDVCQAVGAAVEGVGLRGVRARSAVTGSEGREFAWFPARASSKARMIERVPFEEWWYSKPEILSG